MMNFDSFMAKMVAVGVAVVILACLALLRGCTGDETTGNVASPVGLARIPHARGAGVPMDGWTAHVCERVA